MNQFEYLGSNISFTESDVNICLMKAWSASDRLSIVWKSDLSNKIKLVFTQAVAVSILLYGCTICTLAKRIEKKLGQNYTRMLHAVFNKYWKQHPIKQQLYCHLPLISQTIQIKQMICWALLEKQGWTHQWHSLMDSCSWTCQCCPTSKNLHQLCTDTKCSREDQPEVMD